MKNMTRYTDYKDFKDYCEKNHYTIDQGLEALDRAIREHEEKNKNAL